MAAQEHDLTKVYEFQSRLGRGAQGEVWKARAREGGDIVAIKFVRDEYIKASSRHFRNVRDELMNMRKMENSEHVVKLLGHHYPATAVLGGQSVSGLAIVVELAAHGELFDFLKAKPTPLPMGVAIHYIRQLMLGVIRMHQARVAHRDLKPENIFLSDRFDLMIGDFGLARSYVDDNGYARLLATRCGTRGYMAPEVTSGRGDYDGQLADTWSVGILCFVLMFGYPPMQNAGQGDWWFHQLQTGHPERFWANHERTLRQRGHPCPDDATKAMLLRMLQPDPARRSTLARVAQDDFFKSHAPCLKSDAEREMGERARLIRRAVDAAAAAAAAAPAAAAGSGTNTSVGSRSQFFGGVSRGIASAASPVARVKLDADADTEEARVEAGIADITRRLRALLGTDAHEAAMPVPGTAEAAAGEAAAVAAELAEAAAEEEPQAAPALISRSNAPIQEVAVGRGRAVQLLTSRAKLCFHVTAVPDGYQVVLSPELGAPELVDRVWAAVTSMDC